MVEDRKYLSYGFLTHGQYEPYETTELVTWNYTYIAARDLFVEVCEDPGVCFFLVHHKTKTYDDAPKFKTLEAAVAAAIMMGVPER